MKDATTKVLGLVINMKTFETAAEVDSEGGEGSAVKFVNLYLAQKDAQVRAREDLMDAVIDTTGFAAKTKKLQRKNTKGEAVGEPEEQIDELEGAYIARFKTAVEKGEITEELGLKVTIEKNAAQAFLQSLASKLGPYVLSAKCAERTPSAKRLPKFALDGAKNIYANIKAGKTPLQKWLDNFAQASIEHGDFNTGVEETDLLVLAKAVWEYDAWMRKSQNPYA